MANPALPILMPSLTFDEWRRIPVGTECEDARFEVRRADRSDFSAIYDLVDAAFERKRPHAAYDWLYRKGPLGPARVWILTERVTGRIINASARIPYPLARGGDPIHGALVGDAATAPDFQRQRLTRLRVAAREADPWRRECVVVGWPNAKSRARIRLRPGADGAILGPLVRRALPLRTGPLLRRRGWRGPLADAAGFAGDLAVAARRRLAYPRRRHAVEEVRRFDASFDAATARGMAFEDFWSPHDAVLLNWRYGDHPTHRYAAFACVEDELPVGYTVVRFRGEHAVIAELVFPAERPSVGLALVDRAAQVAREAGCLQLEFFAPPRWPHWRVLRRAGFLDVVSGVYLTAGGLRHLPDVQDLDRWQLVPGDQDAL